MNSSDISLLIILFCVENIVQLHTLIVSPGKTFRSNLHSQHSVMPSLWNLPADAGPLYIIKFLVAPPCSQKRAEAWWSSQVHRVTVLRPSLLQPTSTWYPSCLCQSKDMWIHNAHRHVSPSVSAPSYSTCCLALYLLTSEEAIFPQLQTQASNIISSKSPALLFTLAQPPQKPLFTLKRKEG